MNLIGYIILIAVVVFLFFQIKGLIRDIKARKAKKKENVKNKQAETEKETESSDEK